MLREGYEARFYSHQHPSADRSARTGGPDALYDAPVLETDSGLSPNLWSKVMLTAAYYLRNRIPHTALQMERPHKILCWKDAGPSHLKIIGGIAFGARPLCVVETRNAVFIETTLHLIPQPQLSPLQGD